METRSNRSSLSPIQAMPAGVTDPRVAMLLWVCGKTLILVFLISVFTALLPFHPRSVEWGIQLANRIIDGAFLPLIGVACLRVGSLLPTWPHPIASSSLDTQLSRRRQSALQFARRGVVSLSLLAVLHVLLFLGSVSVIQQRSAANAQALDLSLQREKQLIQRASPSGTESQWQALQRAGEPDLPPALSDPDQQRSWLLARIQTRQIEAGPMASSQGNAARRALLGNALRSLALCLTYIAGFHALGRRRRAEKAGR